MSVDKRVDIEARGEAPLAVDLDGTLIRSDLFVEGMVRLVFGKPWLLASLLFWLTRGRSYAKQRVFQVIDFDPAALPYDERVLSWLNEERGKGRTIVLASACDRVAVEKVANHLGIFDAVFASNGETNLKSERKAERLAAVFPDGFVYAGNEAADIAVWRTAKRAVIVNASPSITERATKEFDVERQFARPSGLADAFVKAIRPQQWSKNLLVFLPMLVGQGWMQAESWLYAFLAFWALSLTASAVYLLNDAADIDADRAHPRKKNRPFAAGTFPLHWGLASVAVFLALGLTLASFVGVLWLALAYLALTTAYSMWLKRVALLDVFLLAGLYTIRIVLGGAATGFPASDWLLAFSCFFFLSLALVKRVAETRDLAARGGGDVSHRGYKSTDTEILTIMGVSAGFVANLVLALYLQDRTITAHYREPFLLWGLPAIGLVWICRLWLKAARDEMDDDPIVFAARDIYSWMLVGAAALCFFGASTLNENIIPAILGR